MTCPDCGTDHDGLPTDSLGGRIHCLRAQAAALEADGLVDQIDALRSNLDTKRDEAIRRHFSDDPEGGRTP